MTPLTMVLAEQTGSETIAYLHGLDLVAQSDGVTTEYFAYDGLGSVRQVADAIGSPLLTQTFDPYGSLYARTGIAETAWGFTGEQTDANGLLHLRARYYAPWQGRFFQLDPSRLEVNPYQYGFGNPVKYVDSNGELPCSPSSGCQDGPTGVDGDDRDLTDWLVREMQANALSDTVASLAALNNLGNNLNQSNIARTLAIAGILDKHLSCGDPVAQMLLLGPVSYKNEVYSQWAALVKTSARWDFKSKIVDELGSSIRLCDSQACRWYSYDVPANVHYGYVGLAAGFYPFELTGGAAVAHMQDNRGTIGDDPYDNAAVRFGIALWHFCKPGTLSASCFSRVLDHYRDSLKKGLRPDIPYYSLYGAKYPLGHFDGGKD